MKESRFGDRHAPCNFARFDSGEVQGGSLSCHSALRGLIVNLDTAHAHPPPKGIDLHFRVLLNPAGDQGSGYDGPKALHHKGAVDRQAERKFHRLGIDFGIQPASDLATRVRLSKTPKAYMAVRQRH